MLPSIAASNPISSRAASSIRRPSAHGCGPRHRAPAPPLRSSTHARMIAPRAASSPSGGSAAPGSALSPERLCHLAREFTETGSGYFSPVNESLFSEDFVFRGPVIGPLCKKDYFDTLGTFKIYESFPDIKSNSWGYSVDPKEPNRVWFFVRQTGTNTGPINLLAPITILPATNKRAAVGPEAYSILFDDEGKVKLLTVGYPVDFDAPGVDCNKFGAAVGLLASVGINLPGGAIFSATQKLAKYLQASGVSKTAKAISEWEDVPQWYKEYVPRREGSEGVPGY